MASMVAAEIESVGALLAAGADFIDRHAVQAPQRGMLQQRARLASSASSSRRLPTLANDSRKASLARATRATLRLLRIMMNQDCTIITTRMAMMTQASIGTALSSPGRRKPKPDCSSSVP